MEGTSAVNCDAPPPPYTEVDSPPQAKAGSQYNPALYPLPPARPGADFSAASRSPRPTSTYLTSPTGLLTKSSSGTGRPLSAQFEKMSFNDTNSTSYFPPPPPHGRSPSLGSFVDSGYIPYTNNASKSPIQRPPPPQHVFSEPYVQPDHKYFEHDNALHYTQSNPPLVHYPPPPPPRVAYLQASGLAPPAIPPRPSSAPPVEVLPPQPQQQVYEAPIYHEGLVISPVSSHGSPATTPTQAHDHLDAKEKDEKNAAFGKRFVGNMLVTRLARSGIQTVASTAHLHNYLSPWGDNNPVTLPNVRKRDIALAGVAHFGVDALADGGTEIVGTVVKSVAAWTSEAAADHGIHIMTGSKTPAVTRTGAAVSTMEVRLRHKLIGEEAVLSYYGDRPADNYVSCRKGWFCPYLYASSRAPKIERRRDFTLGQLVGPGLKADASIAPIVLACLDRTSAALITALCDWHDPSPARPRLGRLAIFFLGISPGRTQSAWSQSRVPNEARFRLHIPDGASAVVLPVNPLTPICAWHSKTLGQIWDQSALGDAQANGDAEAIMGFLRTAVDVSGIHDPQLQQSWPMIVKQKILDMFKAAQALKGASGALGKILDPERAGLVMLRY